MKKLIELMTPKVWIHLGPGKSGSSWLYNYAKANDSIFAIPSIKETHAFHHNEQSFFSFFSHLNCLNPDTIMCDFSNTYIFNPLVAPHLLSHISSFGSCNTFITVLLRCPLERTISHFHYLQASGFLDLKSSFEEFIADDPSILWRSRYDLHLEYLNRCGIPVNIYILEHQNKLKPEILHDVPQVLLNKYVDLVPPSYPAHFSRMQSRSIILSKCAKKTSTYLRSIGHYRLLSNLKESILIRSLFTRPNPSKLSLSSVTSSYLQQYFMPTKTYIEAKGYDVASIWLAASYA